MTKPINFIFIGRSGSGKGTQAELLMEKFPEIYYISTGDLIRKLAALPTDAGVRFKQLLNDGGLLTDDVAIMLWMHEISFNVRGDQGIIGDGFPRRLAEAETLHRFLEWLGRWEDTKLIWIDISPEEATKRLKNRGREDDTDHSIGQRLDWFDHEVMPVINYFKSRNKITRINGEQTIEAVAKEILSKIKE